jgi:enterochelin esterase-like enzyme
MVFVSLVRRCAVLVLGGLLVGLPSIGGETSRAQTPTYLQGEEGPAGSPRGRVVEEQSVSSDLLGRDIPYSVYLPPGYDESERSYPVVYLLHGFTDDETAWVQFGEVQRAADRGIADRTIPPMVIVMPDADSTWYINDAAGTTPYEEAVFQEFIPAVEETYRIRSEAQFRGVAGLSMGGFGTLVWAMRHPEMFAAAAAFSAGIFTEEGMRAMPWDEYRVPFSTVFGGGEEPETRITEHFREHSPLHLARTAPVDSLRSVRWYIDCGDDDFLYEGNSRLHIVLRDREVPHEYRVRNGAHNWTYWREHIGKGLAFIGESFHR